MSQPPLRRRRLPPLLALRHFEAAARLGGFSRAAEELGVTAAAVSQQVRQLEDWLGRPLFARHARGVEMTEYARRLQPALTDQFDQLETEIRRVQEVTSEFGLTVSTLASFAGRWLLPRMERLTAALGGRQVSLLAASTLADFNRDGVDVAIRYGGGRYPGLVAHRILPGRMVVVCAPAMAARLRSPADLARVTLLHDEIDPAGSFVDPGWTDFLRHHGLSGVDGGRGPRYGLTFLCLDAAAAGMGAAIVPLGLAVDALVTGALVRPFAESLDVPHDYWVVYPEDREGARPIRDFLTWIQAEAECQLKALPPPRGGG
ncbi:LysR substrate-binding domain-containing protein [Tistrella mobilis]|uniref:LysR family transcriptional regulator n=1 Tax=Tistrella mobilis (strain KA081020-065) TaxID=1110502 RepID=I3TPA0_TISMK|nr:LysR substrate-binding domain-containing protein [Tistrella mobilis]AFK54588.1 LysR family transcriptional regulator [Tistrella mobilis KA081020-065]